MERTLATTRFLRWVLAMALTFNSTVWSQQSLEPSQTSLTPSPEQIKAAQIKAEVTRRGVGKKSRVRVKLQDKHELKGHITQIEESSFQLEIEPGWLDPPEMKDLRIPIAYADVEKVRGPRSRAASIGIGAGTIVGAIAMLAGIIALEVLKHTHCN